MKNLMQFILFLITVLQTTGATEVIYARVGESVTLNIPNPPGNNYVYWHFGTKQNKEFVWTTPLGGKNPNLADMWKNTLLSVGSLTITNIQEEQFGTFFSKVGIHPNSFYTEFRLIKVSVDVNPASPVMPSDEMSLNCNVKTPEDLGKPRIYWINPEGNRKNGNQEELKLTAKSQVSGQWTCVVYDKKENKFPISVSVADFAPAPPLQFTSINSPLRVPFSITPNNKVQQIIQKIKKVEWHFTPRTSSSSETLFSLSIGTKWMETVVNSRGLRYANFTKDGDISLFKKQAKEDDRGNYTCSITFQNDFRLISAVQVEVLQIVSSPGTELISGNQLNLSCTTGGRLLPGMQVKWFHPKNVHRETAGPPSNRFVIPKVSTEDSGTWRCELLQNQTRLTSAEITLKIDPILSVWMLVTICSAGVILILLLVVAFILYRRRQRRMRHMRHRLCHCTNPKPKGFYKN